MYIKSPEAPATKKQLYRLQELTGGWKLNKQMASDIIQVMELNRLAQDRDAQKMDYSDVPFEEPRVWIVEGEQRSGKTCTGVAKIVDAYHLDCVRIYCEEVLKIKCEVKSYDSRHRVAKIKQEGQIKVVSIPLNYKLHSPMRIYSNIHLFGVPYVFCPSFRHILYWLKSGFMTHGWLLMDEAHVGINARASMTELGQEMEKQSFQYGKAMLNVIIITHMARMIDWTARTIPTERLSCSYDKKTKYITYTMRKKGERGTREISYFAPQYFPYYWTNERINA